MTEVYCSNYLRAHYQGLQHLDVVFSCCSCLAAPPKTRRDCVVQLHQHNHGNAYPCIDEAQRCTRRVERLSDDDAPTDAVSNLGWSVCFDQSLARCMGPAPIEHGA